ncbi:hypothetical protein UCRPA7_6244 [Phaeoacremonium minimum UCRPA7]|uniref:Uncharacterized protein n=1 Tax=Phaeoacremonium minimum (strain UCR-PA7) TaxID=1286976 RepID=R8BG57_PHAM7|nr:hypothetical protein UCRPA7_6244 [Phaeoacremonium minimum UCRPA7]EON98283.1 hypothetical protein UCRPA7_6244 [Phaeoacremonium minimum UCRPA7]
MGLTLPKALALILVALTSSVLAAHQRNERRQDDGYIGYNLEHRGDPESAIYETEDTSSGVDLLVAEPDVYLNASVYVGEINIEVDNITAKVNLDAQVLKLLHFSAGVDASIDRVRLNIQNVSAKVELEARLENVLQMVDDVLHSIDLNPIIATLGQDVGKIVNSTVGILGQTVDENGNPVSGSEKRDLGIPGLSSSLDYNIHHNVLYSVNNYEGKAHTNRVLGQNGSLFDVYLDNDGNEKGRAVVGYYSRDMTFTGHNKTISIDGQVKEYELQYEYRPFHGIEVISWIYLNTVGKVTRTQVISEAWGGGTSTISNDDEDELKK